MGEKGRYQGPSGAARAQPHRSDKILIINNITFDHRVEHYVQTKTTPQTIVEHYVQTKTTPQTIIFQMKKNLPKAHMNRCTNEITLLDQCMAVIRLAHLMRTDYLWIVITILIFSNF